MKVGSPPCNFQKYYLYKDGNEIKNITGGCGKENWTFGNYTLESFSLSSERIILTSATSGNAGVYGTQNIVDLSNFSKLCVECDIISVINNGHRIVLNSTMALNGSTEIGQLNLKTNKFIFDISNYNGSYYIAIWNFGGQYYNEGSIFKICLE